jgi:hypothetical protein
MGTRKMTAAEEKATTQMRRSAACRAEGLHQTVKSKGGGWGPRSPASSWKAVEESGLAQEPEVRDPMSGCFMGLSVYRAIMQARALREVQPEVAREAAPPASNQGALNAKLTRLGKVQQKLAKNVFSNGIRFPGGL